MRRDFLKNLGIEDKELIDKILDENSSDIGRAKGEVEQLKAQIDTLKNEKATLETDLQAVQNKFSDYDDLKTKVSDLTTEKQNLENELNGKVTQLKKDHAIESKIRNAKGKNVKAIMALLDMDKITFENEELGGIDDQLDNLKGAEDSAMLFGETTPKGITPANPPCAGGGNSSATTFAEAIANALKTN